MSAAEGEPEGIGAKADIIPDAVAAIIEQQMTARSSIDLKKFKASLDGDAPPALQALWYQAKGDWKRAHRLAQAQDDKNSAWVHGYLHRIEGDNANAGYWYRCAGKPRSSAPPKKEWEEIVFARPSGVRQCGVIDTGGLELRRLGDEGKFVVGCQSCCLHFKISPTSR